MLVLILVLILRFFHARHSICSHLKQTTVYCWCQNFSIKSKLELQLRANVMFFKFNLLSLSRLKLHGVNATWAHQYFNKMLKNTVDLSFNSNKAGLKSSFLTFQLLYIKSTCTHKNACIQYINKKAEWETCQSINHSLFTSPRPVRSSN